MELKILWCVRTHRVRFYIHVHVYVSNLQNLAIGEFKFDV